MKFTDHLPKMDTVLKATVPQVGDERDGFRERRQRRNIFLYKGLVLAFGPVPVFGTSRLVCQFWLKEGPTMKLRQPAR
jgi:hypothetical protein